MSKRWNQMNGLKAARIAMFMTTILLLGGLFVYIPKEKDAADAIGAPVVQIGLASYRATAYVAPGQDGVVSFTGTVQAQVPVQPNIQYLIVYLQCEAGGWPVTTPPALTFTKAQSEQSFQVQVKVPMETSVQTQGQLSIGARWRYSPGTAGGTVDPVTAIIIIKQYYQFSVGCDKPYVQISPGSSIGFKIRLNNEGNYNDKLRVEILNLAKLTDEGWTVQLSRDKFEVIEKTEQQLVVSVTTPVKFTFWKNKVETIRLRVVSAQAETLGDVSDIADYSLYVRERGFQIPGFEIGFAIMALAILSVMLYGFTQRKRTFS